MSKEIEKLIAEKRAVQEQLKQEKEAAKNVKERENALSA